LVTLLGMATFGAETWLDNAEGFTVLFGIVSRFGPIEAERDSSGRVRVWLRMLGTGLLRGERAGWDRVLFVVLMLSSLAFDGILATPLNTWYVINLGPALAPLGGLQIPTLRTAALVLLTGVFLSAFVLIMRLVMWFGWPQVGSLIGRWKGVDEARALSAFAL